MLQAHGRGNVMRGSEGWQRLPWRLIVNVDSVCRRCPPSFIPSVWLPCEDCFPTETAYNLVPCSVVYDKCFELLECSPFFYREPNPPKSRSLYVSRCLSFLYSFTAQGRSIPAFCQGHSISELISNKKSRFFSKFSWQ